MKFWLIGCGVLLFIIIGLVIFGVYFIKTRFDETAEKLEETRVQYIELEKAHPFEKAPKMVLSVEQTSRFAACRQDLLVSLNETMSSFENEETSWLDKINLIFDIFPALGQDHIAALKKQSMPPSEYAWILEKVITGLKYAGREEAPDKLKELRKAFENASFEMRNNQTETEDTGADGAVSIRTTSSAGVQGTGIQLSSEDPYDVDPGAETIEAIIQNADALIETAELFAKFDGSFLDLYYEGLISKTNQEDPQILKEETPEEEK